MKKLITIFLLLSINGFGASIINIEHSANLYNQLALNHNITSEVKIINIVEWFSKEVEKIEYISQYDKKSNTISAIYYFKDRDKIVGTLIVDFNANDTSYKTIKFRMCMNGSIKNYQDVDAVRAMLTLLSSNRNFEYYGR
jgi:hypothetical protein